jgi:hypothetical protein
VADSNGTRPRQRAVGTRDRIMSHLAVAGEVSDDTGMASGVLAREVGYPGSSIAFAQLLSGMERAGLIRREIRGKRTYRITAGDGALGLAGATGLLRAAKAGQAALGPRRRPAALGLVNGFDYDELARRLLAHVVEQLAATRGDGVGLDQMVAELASERTRQGTLSEENARLREQLRAAQESLARARQVAAQQP